MVRVYLQEIAQFPLLTAEQEIAYATQVGLTHCTNELCCVST
ncbi:hypothetical protein NIES4106_57050 (plasmid) [Fischerella sp. NIES-4106]|nr:hypothetical protein NIES4106_57050 [Fischerella sp. NIES-4106]